MKAFRVEGTFPNGKVIQAFSMDVVSDDEQGARHQAYSVFGSRHRVKRRMLNITSVEVIDAAISQEPNVISAFREGSQEEK
jgi:large subunit ribosomal protein LX